MVLIHFSIFLKKVNLNFNQIRCPWVPPGRKFIFLRMRSLAEGFLCSFDGERDDLRKFDILHFAKETRGVRSGSIVQMVEHRPLAHLSGDHVVM